MTITAPYVAGMFDSGGGVDAHWSAKRPGRPVLKLRVYLSHFGDPELDEFLVRKFGGSLRRKEGVRPRNVWVVRGSRCEAFLRWILPELRLRQVHAGLGLKFVEAMGAMNDAGSRAVKQGVYHALKELRRAEWGDPDEDASEIADGEASDWD